MGQEICVIGFSGGQDSTTLAVWAKKRFKKVCLVGFDYAQKHSVELECAQKIASLLQLPYEIISLDFLENITRSALFKNSNDLMGHSHAQNKDLPNSFVPITRKISLCYYIFLEFLRNFDGTRNLRDRF
ncbi:7-cyano-7-deazaguanine synthase [Helicobacter pylori]|uniref:7-cyano-7-deazaguanine synthase n=1 Tax=Helicobacter pylori TaxID=210 RepID=UPI003C6C0A52